MSEKSAKTIEVFFSYSHKDEELRDELEKHLSLLKQKGVITSWHDRKIGAGKEWKGEIDTHLNTADVILLLISADFLASGYCYDVELKRAMERHEAGEARVIPVILRPVDWKGAPFGKLQALPTDAKPVTKWPDRDEAFLDVVQGIRVAIEELLRVIKPTPDQQALSKRQKRKHLLLTPRKLCLLALLVVVALIVNVWLWKEEMKGVIVGKSDTTVTVWTNSLATKTIEATPDVPTHTLTSHTPAHIPTPTQTPTAATLTVPTVEPVPSFTSPPVAVLPTPLPTHTPVSLPPTPTPTLPSLPTDTPLLPTPMPTDTPVPPPPSPTHTPVPTPTPTPVPPTPTSTPMPLPPTPTPIPIEFLVVQASDDQQFPALAYNPDANEYLLVWGDYRNRNTTKWDIWAQRLSGDGTPIGQPFVISEDPQSQMCPKVAYNPTNREYLIVWYSKFSDDDRDIYARRVSSTTGQLIGDRIPVSVTREANEIHPDIAYNSRSNEYLIVWVDNRTASYYYVYGQRFTSEGAKTGDLITVAETTNEENRWARITYNSTSNEYLVVWDDHVSPSDYQVFAKRVAGQGSLPVDKMPLTQPPAYQQSARAAYNSVKNEYLVVWQDARNSANVLDIYGQILSSEGNKLGNNLSISTATRHQMEPHLTYNRAGNEYLITWQDSRNDESGPDIYGQKLAASGAPIGGNFVVASAPSSQTSPYAAYNPSRNEYLVVWEDRRNNVDYDIWGHIIR